jgi:hypothetical protein
MGPWFKKEIMQAINYGLQLMGQQALCLTEPLIELKDIDLWGGSTLSGLGRLFAADCHCCNQRVLILQSALVDKMAECHELSCVTLC